MTKSTAAQRQPLPVAAAQYSSTTRRVTTSTRPQSEASSGQQILNFPPLPAFLLATFSRRLREAGGRRQEWISKKEIYLPNRLDWLFKDDQEVVETLDYERKLIKHQSPLLPPHTRQPIMFLLAAACLDNRLAVSVPFKGRVRTGPWKFHGQHTCTPCLPAQRTRGPSSVTFPGQSFGRRVTHRRFCQVLLGEVCRRPRSGHWKQLQAVYRFEGRAH